MICSVEQNHWTDLSLALRSGQYMAPPEKDPIGNEAAGPSPSRLSRWGLTCSLYTMARPRKGPGSACSHTPALNAASYVRNCSGKQTLKYSAKIMAMGLVARKYHRTAIARLDVFPTMSVEGPRTS